jgi:hypothetical protein
MRNHPHGPRWHKWPLRFLMIVALLLLGPIGVLAFGNLNLYTHWSAASMASSGQAPEPSQEPEALVQVYGARAYNWRGAWTANGCARSRAPFTGDGSPTRSSAPTMARRELVDGDAHRVQSLRRPNMDESGNRGCTTLHAIRARRWDKSPGQVTGPVPAPALESP